jgi:hypothetical protein
MENQLFTVHPRHTNVHVVVWAMGREHAKSRAESWLQGSYGGKDNWDVIPITAPGDRVHLDITLSV